MADGRARRWTREAAPLVAGRAASAIAGILVPVVLARLLSPAQYGSFKQAFLIATTGAGFVQLGIYQSLYYFLPREPGGARAYLVQANAYLTAAGLVAGVLLYAAGGPIARMMHNPGLSRSLLPMALFCAFWTASVPLEHGLIAAGRLSRGGLAYVLSELTRVAVQVGAARRYGTVEAILWASAAFAIARTATSWIVALRSGRGPLWEKARLSAQWRYSLPFGAAALLMIPQQSLHQYVVSAWVTPARFAIYAVGCLQLPIVELLYTPISDLMILRIGEADRRGDADRARESFREAVASLSGIFLPAAAGLWALAPAALPFVFGARYADAVPIFRLSVASLVLASFPVDGVLRARARKRFFFWAQVGKLGLTALFVVVGLRALGLPGAVVGQVGAQALVVVLMLWESGRALGATTRALLPWRRLVAGSLPAVAAGLAAGMARPHLAHAPVSQMALASVLFAAVWGLALLALRKARRSAAGAPGAI